MKNLLTITILFCTLFAQAQSVQVYQIQEAITLDGQLNEAIWQRAEPATDFWQYFPQDSIHTPQDTEIFMAYDADYLYIGVKCYSVGNQYVVPSLRRDYRAGGNDNISLMFDTYADGNNAFLFGINPYGVRREALISLGGNTLQGFQTSWDQKWEGEAHIGDGFWSAELKIPFKILRFNEGATRWRFNTYRFDTQSNENSVWQRIPRQQWIFNLAFSGDMLFEQPLPKAGKNIVLIPYATAGVSQDFEEIGDEPKDFYGVGGDAKIGVTSGLNLDLTANPDFSQVEVDRQQTNLDRFELFFPERRQFFLENADLFNGFGFRRMNPFFSRRIGIAQDTTTGTAIQNPIYGGARLSGKVNDDLRIGLLSMQTANDIENGLPNYNYTVAAVQQKVFNRSNVGAILVNKQSFDEQIDERYNAFNRVAGLDFNFRSEDNAWVSKTFYHHSFSADRREADNKDGGQYGAFLQYTKRWGELSVNYLHVGENFNAEVGFVPRLGQYRVNPEVKFFFFPKKGKINRHEVGVEYARTWTLEEPLTDESTEFSWNMSFENNQRLNLRAENRYTLLTFDFDPTNTGGEPLLSGTAYRNWSFQGSFRSDNRKSFFFDFDPTIGQYFNGIRYGIRGAFNYRFQPFGAIALSYNYNYIQLPEPYETASLFLIGPRIDVTFSKKLFLTTFIQYNNQIDNININARLQWRFRPVSDFFIVYTDNYSTLFNVKNRAIVAKFTYWLNL